MSIVGTSVLTLSGYKNIEEVALNDKLITHIGEYCMISNKEIKIYSGFIYTIKCMFIPTPIKCMEDQSLYVRTFSRVYKNKKYMNEFSNPTWITSSKITANSFIGIPINKDAIVPEFTLSKIINQHKTNKIIIKITEDYEWYMLGYFIGDGWVQDSKKKDGRYSE
jgi:hypothetical protein